MSDAFHGQRPATSASRVSPDEILDYWFADALGNPALAASRMAFWFNSTPEEDGAVARRFKITLQQAADGTLAHWETEARSALALVIVLDQFPRNIHRGTPAAFDYDREALNVARHGVAAGHLRALTTLEQAFFLMPFQHCEDRACQREGVVFFQRMTEEASSEWRPVAESMLRYAHLHRNIIERYGRFPHRNRILARTSTAEEQQYLTADHESFGQTVKPE
jgi:uncharacterized protein (DUF924 family)